MARWCERQPASGGWEASATKTTFHGWRRARRAAECAGQVSPSAVQWFDARDRPRSAYRRTASPSLAWLEQCQPSPPKRGARLRGGVSERAGAAAAARRAAWNGNGAKLRAVVEKFPSVLTAHEASDGSTPTHWACLGGHAHVLTLLQNLGCTADHLDACDSAGQTPFHWAAAHNKTSCIEELTRFRPSQAERLALWRHRDKRGRTAAHLAALHGNARTLNCMRLQYAGEEQTLLEILTSRDNTHRTVMDLWSTHRDKWLPTPVLRDCLSKTRVAIQSNLRASACPSDPSQRPHSADQTTIAECRQLMAEIEFISAQSASHCQCRVRCKF